MVRKFIKYFSIITAPMLLLTILLLNNISVLPDKIYIGDTDQVSETTFQSKFSLSKVKLVNDKIKVSLLGLIPVKSVSVQKVSDFELYPGGTSVGVRLSTNGVLVVGFSEVLSNDGYNVSPAKDSGIEIGDIILKADGKPINTTLELVSKIKSLKDGSMSLEIQRKENLIQKELKLIKESENYKMGLWVRDSTAGIGTLTFYHKDSQIFGALGHPITDSDTNTAFSIRKGDLLKSSILSVRKGERGNPGELKGLFINDKQSIGSITKNTKSGIYGLLSEPIENPNYNVPMKVAFRNEIQEGKAKIITTIDENGPREFEIEIVKLLQQDKASPKSMVIKVTDEELLQKTGGIVQGMSGSPIIQNDKIVGAVTHVLINKPELGYGIYIEWMLQDAGLLN